MPYFAKFCPTSVFRGIIGQTPLKPMNSPTKSKNCETPPLFGGVFISSLIPCNFSISSSGFFEENGLIIFVHEHQVVYQTFQNLVMPLAPSFFSRILPDQTQHRRNLRVQVIVSHFELDLFYF